MNTDVVRPATNLTGHEVRNPEGEKLGSVEDLVIDLATGRVAYAVLSFGGFLGLGEKYFPIPWAALAHDPENDAFVLNVSKETLEEAEGFDRDELPDFADLEVRTRIYRHYRVQPYWEA